MTTTLPIALESLLLSNYGYGDISVSDSTGLSAMVIFDRTNGRGGKMTVNGKELIYPISTCYPEDAEPYCYFSLTGDKKKITTRFFDKNTVVIKIQNRESNMTLYVDTRLEMKTQAGSFLEVHNHKPKILSQDEALDKVSHLEARFPHFQPHFGGYNQHGVALFGWDTKEGRSAFYWASPAESHVHKLECSEIKIPDSRTGEGEYIVKSEDGFVLFTAYVKITFDRNQPISRNYFINSTRAEILPLVTPNINDQNERGDSIAYTRDYFRAGKRTTPP
ncbi:MAG: hypothetical protein K1000chlam4_00998, partial [Chlamydiae bacterium]|nr:hypothetical protein [Chlamydiota bacterium]